MLVLCFAGFNAHVIGHTLKTVTTKDHAIYPYLEKQLIAFRLHGESSISKLTSLRMKIE